LTVFELQFRISAACSAVINGSQVISPSLSSSRPRTTTFDLRSRVGGPSPAPKCDISPSRSGVVARLNQVEQPNLVRIGAELHGRVIQNEEIEIAQSAQPN